MAASVLALLLVAAVIPHHLGAILPAGHRVTATHGVLYQALPASAFDLSIDGLAGFLILLVICGNCRVPALQTAAPPAEFAVPTIRPPPAR